MFPTNQAGNASSDRAENQSLQLTPLNAFLGAMQRLPEVTVPSLWSHLLSFLWEEGGPRDADRCRSIARDKLGCNTGQRRKNGTQGVGLDTYDG